MGQGAMYLWAVAGVYLVYLGIRQFIALFRGEASIPWLNACAGVVFIAIGAAVILREWRAYRKARAENSGPEDSTDEFTEEDDDTEQEETE